MNKAVLLAVTCTVLAFGAGTAATFAFRPKPAEAPKAPELPKSYRAERFEVADPAGKVRAWLGSAADGSPQVGVADAEGRPRAVLTVDAKVASVALSDAGAAVTLRTPSGKQAVAITSSKDGASSIALGSGKAPAAALSADAAGDASLAFSGADGAPRASFAPGKDGYVLEVRDDSGVRRTEVGAKGVTAPQIVVRDAEGQARARLSVDKERGAELALLTAAGLPRTQLNEHGSLTLSDEVGRTRAALEASEANGGWVKVSDAAGVMRASLASGPDGTPGLDLREETGGTVVAMSVRKDGTGSIALLDAKTKIIRAWLDTAATGDTSLGFYDVTGKLRQLVGIDSLSIPYLKLLTSEEKIRVCLYAEEAKTASLDFRNVDNKSVVSLFVSGDLKPGLSMRDAELQDRVWLGVNDTDWTLFNMGDSEGRSRVLQGVRPDASPYIGLSDAAGKSRFLLDTDSAGRPSLGMYDSAGNNRIGMYLSTDSESSQLRFNDPSGNERIWLGYDNAGGIAMNFFDDSKRIRMSLGTAKDGTPSQGFYDTARARLSFALTTNGLPVAHATDSNGKDRLQFGLLEGTETGRFNVLDGNNTVLWSGGP
jgi:hypothetical protein